MQDLWHIGTSIIGTLVLGGIFGGIKMYSQIQTNNAEITQLKIDHRENRQAIAEQDLRQRGMQDMLTRIDENVKRLLVEPKVKP